MLPDIHRATQKFYIFLIVYLTGCTPFYQSTSIFTPLLLTDSFVRISSQIAEINLLSLSDLHLLRNGFLQIPYLFPVPARLLLTYMEASEDVLHESCSRFFRNGYLQYLKYHSLKFFVYFFCVVSELLRNWQHTHLFWQSHVGNLPAYFSMSHASVLS